VAKPGDDFVGGGNVLALSGPDDGLRNPRAQKTIFTEGFFITAESRVADRLDNQRESLVDVNGAGLSGYGSVDAAKQIHVPGAAQRGAFREDRRAGAHQAVRSFLALQEWNPQARLTHGDPLKPVEILRLLAWTFVEDGVGQCEEPATRAKALH
jgi:hypothetical protein